jgi:hypothetical protein
MTADESIQKIFAKNKKGIFSYTLTIDLIIGRADFLPNGPSTLETKF